MLEKLNKKFLITPKLLYLFIELTYATLASFRYGFIVNGMGISPTSYSVMYGYCMLISFSSNICIALTFDKLNSPKVFFLGLLLISGSALQTICWLRGSLHENIFWVLMFVYFTFNGSLIPLLDRHVLTMLPHMGAQVKDYGAQRMFGTLACPIASFLIETILKINTKKGEKYNFDNLKYYHIVFISLAMFMVWMFVEKVVSPVMPIYDVEETENPSVIPISDVKKREEFPAIPIANVKRTEASETEEKEEYKLHENKNKATFKNDSEFKTNSEVTKKTDMAETSIDKQNTVTTSDSTNTGNAADTSSRVRLLDLITNFPYMYFIVIIFLNGISRQGMTLFFQNYRSSFLNLEPYDLSALPRILAIPLHYTFNNNPISTTDAIGTGIEIACYFNSRRITTVFGLYWPLIFGQLAAIFRFISYFNLSEKNSHKYLITCCIEVLRGINYGMTHVSGVQLVLYMCPKNLKGTSQMVYCGVIGLGGAVAGRIAKVLFHGDKMGRAEYEKFFLVNTLISVVCLSMILLKYGVIEGVIWRRSGNIVAKEEEEDK
ncbi:hypothetical protein CDIK_1365 [Cucumispora dikerogammari]|nr:hypothetical protein CDIK_1365 [Cucumispora dikerogammari]